MAEQTEWISALKRRCAARGGEFYKCRCNLARKVECAPPAGQAHDLSRTLIRIWIAKCESGEFDPDVEAATLLGDYEAKIATLERMVGRQAVEIEFLKGALQQGRSPRSAPMSVIAGPAVSPSLKDAG